MTLRTDVLSFIHISGIRLDDACQTSTLQSSNSQQRFIWENKDPLRFLLARLPGLESVWMFSLRCDAWQFLFWVVLGEFDKIGKKSCNLFLLARQRAVGAIAARRHCFLFKLSLAQHQQQVLQQLLQVCESGFKIEAALKSIKTPHKKDLFPNNLEI